MALAKEESIAKLIFNFSANTHKAGKTKQTKGYLVGRRKLLEDYWTKFNEAHDIISTMESTEVNEKDLQRLLSDERFASIESAYCEALGDLNDVIDELSTTAHEPMSHSTPTRLVVNGGISTIKSTLPPLQLPTFDGSFEEWLNFKDMFTSCVINDKMLSDVQRLHYLNCSLRGSATSVLKNIRVSEDNFQTAWDILKGRYDNKRKLIKQYLHDIVNLPTMANESSVVLRQILDGITEAVRALQQLGRPTDQWDDWLILHVTQKLDPVTIKDWETSLESPNSIPTYVQLEKFLENRLQGLDAMAACSRPKQKEPNQQKAIKAQPVRSHQANVNRCPKCSGKHVLMFCSDFRKETPAQRMTFVTKAKLCKNCLKADHAQQQCPSEYTCLRCHQKHHTMLHDNIPSQEPHVNTNHLRTNNTCNPPHSANSRCEISDGDSLVQLEPVLLATAQVGVRSATGHKLKLRALLDIGSQATFISEYAVQQLHLRRTRLFMPVTGVGGTNVGKSTGLVDISVSSLREPDFNINCRALILPRLGPLMPTLRLDTKQFGEFLDLDLADPDFCEPGSIDVILGADVYGSLLCGEILQLSAGAPVAQHTHLGWVIFGRLPESTTRTLSTNFCAFSQSELADLVHSMWKFNEHEDVESSSKMTQDEFYCEEFFKQTVQRTCSGRYVIKYPFKDSIDQTNLADSKGDAYKLFHHQLNRLEKDPKMRTMYDEFMSEYLQLGHMEPVHEDVSPQQTCYIPHHGVYKESSSTTKLRIVFNASRKYKSGKTLNDCLHVGPKLQSELSAIILKWRTHRIGFMADIEKCYRQILVQRDDADMQRIIWKDEEGRPAVYRLLTVTYGLNCSPYVTIKVLHTLADDEEADFPQAAKVLRESFYMDDCLHGADSVEAAQQLQLELQSLLQRGGFLLRKWNSNSTEFLQGISMHDKLIEQCCDLNLDRETKALGIYWFCQTDCIGYKVNVTKVSIAITKRQQLSDVAKIYDPTCLLAPVVITGKIMSQQLWLSGISWDDPLPEPHQKNWVQFRDELPSIEDIKVPRWIFSSPNASSYQLHVFSDASTSAYAAVSYLRVRTFDGECKVSILMAKTKVAPLKKITVPCLELNGALLASKVASKVLDTLQLPSITTYCWSDSKTTLSWIRSNPGKHKQYVANRITKIQELTTIDCWRYVPTKSNPADVASRGVYPSQLQNLDLWWSGPTWLQKDESEWPEQKGVFSDVHEVTALLATHSPSNLTEDKKALGLLYKYSDINTLIGVTCWCNRYIAIQLKQPHATSSWCTASERQAALQFWIRYVQRIHFNNEISCLLQGKPVSSKSKLMKLNPMIDDNGIIRLNGRLKNALLTVSERFPIILPKESKLTSLLIDQAHNATMHGGKQTTINFLRRRYWIIDCRSSVQKFIRRCLTCCRHKPQPTTQIMGILPTPRCTAAAPFKNSGLDYAGPYAIRTTKGRGHRTYKGWVALFVCLSTRAIHLELVSDMTTETFLAALRRFFSQRGYSSSIYSDCATTFAGANAVLKQDFAAYRKQLEAGARSVSCHGVSWHFIPPGSPNFGGIWEAGVKSMKHHLKRTIGEATLTFEEFYTVLKQIEAVLNSRPISALSDDPGDFAALTPGHFLVGGPITATPEPDLTDIKTGRLSRWKQLQQMQQDFWKRWSCEYLHDLQVRSKWQKSTTNIKVGDLVLVRDERAPPTQWLLGRVLEVHTGEDDLVRVATIRTQSSIIRRAISKLVLLPVDNDSADEHGGRPDVSSQ